MTKAPRWLFAAGAVLGISLNISNSLDAQSNGGTAQETEVRGYWADPATGSMWAVKDNGENVNWHRAMKYCSDLRLGGYSDWRLPTIDELQVIYDASGFAAPPPLKGMEWALAGKPKGGLILTGAREWSSSRVLDDRGHHTGFAWQFDFPHGKRWHDPIGYNGSLRALCMPGP
jgi:hypothetical protein